MSRAIVRAVGYVRVSTAKQAAFGVSLDVQRRQIEEVCQERGWKLVEVFTDRGKSAKTMSREGMASALATLNGGDADALVFAKSDRATRSVRDLYDLMDDSVRRGWTLVDLETSFDSCDPTGRMIAGMRGVVSQWEREMIGKRTKDALAEKRMQGVRLGRPPLVSEVAVAAIRRMKKEGLTVRGIAKALNDDGVPSATGKSWHSTSVHRLLK